MMTTEEQMRAEFEANWNKQTVPHPDTYFEYDCSHKQCAYESWQACQRMNDERNKLQEKPE